MGKTVARFTHCLPGSISRFTLLACLLFLLVACTQAAPIHKGSSSSFPGNAALQSLQQRALHFPAVKPGSSCPTSSEQRVNPSFGIAQGKGPAYVAPGAKSITSPAILLYSDAQHFGGNSRSNQGWGGQKVLWFMNPNYQGLVLVRGHQLDGPHGIRFGPELDQQLVLNTKLGGGPWPNFPSYTRLQAPGCYAYQVDGATFSYLIVFQAVLTP